MTELISVEKWRNLCCTPFRYYLWKCDLSHTYRSRNYRWKLKLSWNFIYVKAYIFTCFNSYQTVCFCPSIVHFTCLLHDHLLTVERKGQFSIFTSILKRSHHFVSFKLSLLTNGMHHKLTCISRFWRPIRTWSSRLSRNFKFYSCFAYLMNDGDRMIQIASLRIIASLRTHL